MRVTPILPETQYQTSKDGSNTSHARSQIYCTIYLDVEYLSVVAEELPEGKEINGSKMCPYMERRSRAPECQRARRLGTLRRVNSPKHQSRWPLGWKAEGLSVSSDY